MFLVVAWVEGTYGVAEFGPDAGAIGETIGGRA